MSPAVVKKWFGEWLGNSKLAVTIYLDIYPESLIKSK
jgi:hypothetical protein